MPELFRPAGAALASAIALVAIAAVPGLAADPALVCHGGKLKLAGKYEMCRLGADSKARKAGDVPDYSKCDATLESKWQDAETKAGLGVCPTEGDRGENQDYLALCEVAIDGALSGQTLPGCLGTSLTLKTGQTTCYDAAGVPMACAGSGQDGEFQKGLDHSFTDNGDGTITDNVTGLVWEKLSDDGSVHDQHDSFTWIDSFSKITALNAMGFAGHNDWRVPNVVELATIVDLGVSSPATFPIFHSGCVPGCTVLTCNCTLTDDFWSSTNVLEYGGYVSVGGRGDTKFTFKNNSLRVRAVRAGS